MIIESELYHHGVKGMHWGIRRYQPYGHGGYKPQTIRLGDVTIHKSVGAKSYNYKIIDKKTGKSYYILEGTKIRNVQVFAGKGTNNPLHDNVKFGLTSKYGGKPRNWQHCKGDATLDVNNVGEDAEIHWFQESSVGKYAFKVKRWYK